MKTLAQKLRDIFNSVSPNGHMWLPGAGTNNGFDPKNYLDSAGTTPASTDGLCGLALDSGSGTINASQPTVGSKPYERKGIVNLLLGSSSPVARIVTPSAAPYTLAMIGTGSVVVSGGHVGTLTGTGAADLVVMNFTPTTIATTFTPTGSVTSFGLFQGTLTAQQILAYGGIPLTTTAAASSTLGPQYWEFLASASRYMSLNSNPIGSTLSQPYTIIAAGVLNSVVANRSLYGDGARVVRITATGKLNVANEGTINLSGTASITEGVPFVAEVVWNGTTLSTWVNGVADISGASFGAPVSAASTAMIGQRGNSSEYWDGGMFPMFVTNSALSDADRTLMRKFVAQCAGVTL